MPGERRAGALIYRGGLLLSSADKRFGGWSDLAVSADGNELLSISDEAHWLSAWLVYDKAGNLAGLNAAEIAPMLNPAGRPMRGKAGRCRGGSRSSVRKIFTGPSSSVSSATCGSGATI
jgi:hypothetical protein